MAESPISTTTPPRKRRWLRVVVTILAVFIVLLVAVYFAATSSAFLKGVVLPRVSKSLNAEVTITDASISPFKQVILHNLKVRTTGDEPLVTASEVRTRYRLMDILGGNIHVDELTLVSPTIVLVENPDGSSNLDPILKGQKEKAKETRDAQPAKPSKPTQINVKQLSLTEGTVRRVKLYQNGNRDVTELSHVNVTVDDVKNGQSGKMALNADIKAQNNPPLPGTNGLLQAKVTGNFVFALTADLKPASMQGKARFDITQAAGGFADLNTLGAELICEASPSEIKQIVLRFQKGGAELGQIHVSGPFDSEKMEGRLLVQVLSIDKQVLNAAGAKNGIDFGTTLFNSTNEIQLAKGGSAITAKGTFDLGKLQLIRAQQTTPTVDVHSEYNVTVDNTAKNALLNSLTIIGTQKGNPLLRAELTSPMTISWGNVSNAVGDSALNVTLTHLNLSDWKAFLGETPPTGDANLKLTLLSQQAGKKLTFDLNSQVDNLTAGSGSNQITQANVTFQLQGKASELKQFELTDYKLKVAKQNETLVSVSGSGTYDSAGQNADLQVTGQIKLAKLVESMPRPDMAVSSGTAELKVHVVQTTQAPGTPRESSTRNITGAFILTDFTGKFGSNEFSSFGSTMELDIGVTPQQAQIRKLAGKLTQGPNAGGSFDLSATYDLTNKSSQFTAKLTDFNQNGLRPFLEPMLANKKLVSVAINGSASGQYHPNGDSALKANLQMANLVVNDPSHQFPVTPLEAKMQVDASVHNQIADVRQFQIGLTPTERGKNELQFKGQVDMSKTNATQGNLKLFADSLDVTSYYDLFNGEKKTPNKQAAATAPTPAPAAPLPATTEKEPDAKHLPFQNFIADVNIGRFYLREVEITNLVATAKIDGGRVLLNPFKLVLNGAPVSATLDLDLSVPGYRYDLDLNAKAIPLAPLVNTFQPERKGQIGGTLTPLVKLTTTGTTGASLKKNLAGRFDIDSTNLNLAVVNIKSPLLKTLINVIAVIPDLAQNPTVALGAVFGKGGLSDDLAKAPIQTINAHGVAGTGKVDLQQAIIQSAAFKAEAGGNILLADILTNSAIQIPVSVSLSRGIAQKLSLLSADAPTNEAYAKLPDFVTMKGTVGDPKADINKVALAGTAFKTIGGIVSGLGGKSSGGLIKSAGDLLSGKSGATNAPPKTGTNQPPSIQPAVNDLLNQFLKPKKK